MAQATSIHIDTAKSFAFAHNDRTKTPLYVVRDSQDNECDKSANEANEELKALYNTAKNNYQSRTKQKLQVKNILAEAVIVIEDRHTIADIQAVAKMIEEKTGYTAIQSSIHRDEGKDRGNLNIHAHIVFFTLDKETGKSLQRQNFNKKDKMRDLQTATAEILSMERGRPKETTKAEHLTHQQYKASIAIAEKHKEQEIHKWHNKLKEKVVHILESTTTAIKRFFMSNEFEKVEQENNHLKRTITQSKEAITQAQHKNELLTREANIYKEELITEKAKYITAEQTTLAERPSQLNQTRSRTR
jgi:hypothetical protein